VESVRDLEHREHDSALRAGPGFVPAAGRPPDEIAGLAFAFAADEGSLEHVRLLDQHMLVIGQPRARSELHQ
jgi:hypothetical protein